MFQGLIVKNKEHGVFSGQLNQSLTRYEDLRLQKNDFQCHRLDKMTVTAYEQFE